VSTPEIRAAFGQRLTRALRERGLSQVELARRMAPLLPTSRIGRDNVSKWCAGKVLPLPHFLHAMAKVLDMKVTDLLPARRPLPPPASLDTPAFQIAGWWGSYTATDPTSDRGRLVVRVDKELPSAAAIAIMEALRGTSMASLRPFFFRS
jgi:transcriptional regulator with XRE-family HTH domain